MQTTKPKTQLHNKMYNIIEKGKYASMMKYLDKVQEQLYKKKEFLNLLDDKTKQHMM